MNRRSFFQFIGAAPAAALLLKFRKPLTPVVDKGQGLGDAYFVIDGMKVPAVCLHPPDGCEFKGTFTAPRTMELTQVEFICHRNGATYRGESDFTAIKMAMDDSIQFTWEVL